MSVILSFLVSAALALLAFSQTRRFVSQRLRYVDAVQTAIAPIVAGVAAGVVTLPIFHFLPLVGADTAISVGLAVGAGVASGARDVRHTLPRY